MRKITLDNTSYRDFHQFMLGAIVPRPIALVSTIDARGILNIAPFSYFNAVSSAPPILMISIGRKIPDGGKKDTLLNIEETKELVINLVPESMAQQMTLCSVAYEKDIDEFQKSGLTPQNSHHVSPPRIEEASIQFECSLNQIISLSPGSSNEINVVFCDVKCIHISETIIGPNNRVMPEKAGIIGRLGRSNYTKVNEESIFSIYRAPHKIPLGFDNLPETLRKSTVLSKNDLGQLAGELSWPTQEEETKFDREFEKEFSTPISTSKIIDIIKHRINKDDIRAALYLTHKLKNPARNRVIKN